MVQPHKRSGALLAAALLIGAADISLAGVPESDVKTVASPPRESNSLSFLGGAVVFDFEERFRWEIRNNNFDFDDSVNALTDDNWFLQRARLGVKITLADWLRIYGQVQDSREINSDRPDYPNSLAAEGDDSLDLRQAWVEFGNPKEFPLTLKLGRQILSYGDERLIGAFDWNNIGRTFDAARLRWEEKTWSLDAFAGSVVVPERGSYNQSDFFNGNETDRQQIFSGLYFQTTAVPFQATDLYVLHLHEDDSVKYQPNPDGDTNFFTLGVRAKSKPGAFARQETVPVDGKESRDGKQVAVATPPRPVGFDYEAEFAFQTGHVRGLDLTAFAAHGGVGYTLDTRWLPRLGLAYSFATGDNDSTDHDIETFQNLFPTNHKFYGQMDLFSWQNMHDLEVNLKVSPIRALTLRAEYHAFWLQTTEDFWYRANGTTTVRPLNAAARNAGNYVGSEVDLLATWNVTRNLQVEGGYSHFFTGEYVAATGPSDDADFGYLQVKVTF